MPSFRWWRRPSSFADQPGAALFRGLRLKLTLWYSGVLAISLIIVGVILYLTLQHYLLQPVTSEVAALAQQMAQPSDHPLGHGGSSFVLPQGCGMGGNQQPGGNPPPSGPATPASPVLVYVACFDSEGNLLGAGVSQPGMPSSDVPPPFEMSDLVKAAIRNGTASGQVDGGTGVGTVYRAASVIRDSNGNPIAVVQVGRSIQEQLDALSLVRLLLLVLGGASLVIATIGGSLLARRALAPAHLAFQRQRDFIADASHELRTPLTLLRADAEVLLRGRDQLPAEDAELLDDIVTETSRMEHLASHLLLLARIDAGQLHLEYDMIDLNDVLSTVAQRVGSLATEYGIRIDTGASAPIRVLGDRLALERALLILVDNAIKYTSAGGTVTIAAGSDGDTANLQVSDTGVGIAPEHLPRLSERFYRVDRARARESGGVGLGLSIAEGIARAHGGDLRIKSQPGQGTAVRLSVAARGPSK